ncbi:hypothetical protein HPB48_019535 [Haemaphysalis longicornis]|uniref:Integrase catalytic domain-containing protein n=1 Tax=Haemaphysalis longicornis TaxID=44386 RepID=A0A9J6GV52_HAELO|nr:hypothetical protein HPB48_019535 [Haemaphysalis longicornis]
METWNAQKNKYQTVRQGSAATKYALFLRRADVEHQFASSYHPQANGLIERTNQTIQAWLAPYVETNKAREAD